MRQQIDISLARFLMLLSLVLLGVLEYLWLHNEYKNKYRDMEDKLTHVMFSTMRDVEDSLIFSNIAQVRTRSNLHDTAGPVRFNIVIQTEDSVKAMDERGTKYRVENEKFAFKTRHPMRGMLLKELTSDSTVFDTPVFNISSMVMRHIRLADSTGEFAGYKMISWQNGDTLIREAMGRPQFDVMAGRKIALTNPNYKAEIFHDLLPHFSFAVFLWLMVGASFYYTWKNLRKQMQLNALRDEFVSNITHELKTPITTVGVALESLHLSDELNTKQSKRYLEICQSELKRLSMLVERILHNRSPQIHYEKMDMRQVLDDVMHHMRVQFDNKHAKVEVKQEGDGFIINGDKAHMSGVLYNLLDNALKYSLDHPEIQVRLTRLNRMIRLDIKDNGIGIEKDFHIKIFEKLFRVPHQNRHDVKGHGLGLSYVADIVQMHHGRIELISEPGSGSTFSLMFPAYHAKSDPVTGPTAVHDPQLN